MKPSSKIGHLALVALAALWPTAGAAGPSVRPFGAPPHVRQVLAPAMHAMHPGRPAIGLEGRFSRRRFGPAAFAYEYAWPGYWSGTLPGYYPPANAEEGPPLFYPLPGAARFAACSKPLVIRISPEKPRRDLPRVIYGTPSFCPG